MRKIKINRWKAKTNDEEIEETTLTALDTLIKLASQKEMPQGLDKFKIYSKLVKAFDKATEKGTLILEETEYEYLKDLIENKVPAQWAMNENIRGAIEEFLEAKEE